MSGGFSLDSRRHGIDGTTRGPGHAFTLRRIIAIIAAKYAVIRRYKAIPVV
jgi:hypothetical protein